MCGLTISIGETFAKTSLSLLHHRGPDAGEIKEFNFEGEIIEFGHRRLAINDLSPRSNQPMSWGKERYWLVYNGEIYNFLELKTELEALGCEFKTTSDSEVLIAALATWGEAVIPRLVGMFTFALLDLFKGEILIARDAFGIKPLFFTQTKEGLAFASEIPPLLEYPGVKRQANSQKVYDYIVFGQTDGDTQTLFTDIRTFPPSHFCKINLKDKTHAIKLIEYSIPQQKKYQSYEEAALSIREIFLENIHLHMRSDVAIGSTLSGGIDSTAILAGMRIAGGKNLELNTFSFVTPGSDISEDKWIKIAADAMGAKNHTVEIHPEDLMTDLDKLISLQGEPFGSSRIYAQYKVMELAKRHGIKVLLDGQGADEIFAGYLPFLSARLADMIQQGKFIQASQFLRHSSKIPGSSLQKQTLQALGELIPDKYRASARKMIGMSPEPHWVNKKWLNDRGVSLMLPFRRNTGKGILRDRLNDSLSKTVLPSLLRFQDRNSMAFSIEARVPFLTSKLVAASHACPPEYLISQNGTTKSVFRTAMQGIIPDEILARRDKIGFATPEKDWLVALNPWIKKTFDNFSFEKRMPFLYQSKLMNHIHDTLKGNVPFDYKIWRIINLVRWADIYGVSFE